MYGSLKNASNVESTGKLSFEKKYIIGDDDQTVNSVKYY